MGLKPSITFVAVKKEEAEHTFLWPDQAVSSTLLLIKLIDKHQILAKKRVHRQTRKNSNHLHIRNTEIQNLKRWCDVRMVCLLRPVAIMRKLFEIMKHPIHFSYIINNTTVMFTTMIVYKKKKCLQQCTVSLETVIHLS